MEKKINRKIDEWTKTFKHSVKDVILNTNDKQEIVDYIYGYNGLQLTKCDFAKRKRVKNIVPLNERCNALRANSEQCTRRRKGESIYCGTHIKGIPHGEITDDIKKSSVKIKKVWAQEIRGIIYYIDNNNNVYNHTDILNNIDNPGVIAKYTFDPTTSKYDIPNLFK